ncbi:hypothetical protein BT69DRAFT_1325198 [Atractiella rhizophila]|nr:hypothetical protein BT69DRAFT_1325198 [Atractiella rhizophila]
MTSDINFSLADALFGEQENNISWVYDRSVVEDIATPPSISEAIPHVTTQHLRRGSLHTAPRRSASGNVTPISGTGRTTKQLMGSPSYKKNRESAMIMDLIDSVKRRRRSAGRSAPFSESTTDALARKESPEPVMICLSCPIHCRGPLSSPGSTIPSTAVSPISHNENDEDEVHEILGLGAETSEVPLRIDKGRFIVGRSRKRNAEDAGLPNAKRRRIAGLQELLQQLQKPNSRGRDSEADPPYDCEEGGHCKRKRNQR